MYADTASTIFVGKSAKPESLLLKFANRHGSISGATGAGKTVTLQVLAEGFSRHGVPVFAADVKGDLSGIAEKGVSKPFLEKRAREAGLGEHSFKACPTIFWDVFGEQGHPIRSPIGKLGPLLLAHLLELNETQEGVLTIAFRIAAEQKLPLADLRDLRRLLSHMAEHAAELSSRYGEMTKPSIASIQRRLLVLDEQRAELFFGEPALDIDDLMLKSTGGEGYINILAAEKLIAYPRLYSTLILWLLTSLYERLPEVGDLDKPKLVFFVDEAHLLFSGTSKTLLERIEQLTRLIRSKGVGIYYVTQNPIDVPDRVSSQLGNRVQHGLRAYTIREQKAVKAAAETFRANPGLDTAQAILELGTGEALVSFLEEKGEPSVVQRTLIRPPGSMIGPVSGERRRQIISLSPLAGKYEKGGEGIVAEQGEFPKGPPAEARQKENSRKSHGEAFRKSFIRSFSSAVGRLIRNGMKG